MHGKRPSKPGRFPVERGSRLNRVVEFLVGYLPAEDGEHHDQEEAPCGLRHSPATEPPVVEEPAPEDVGETGDDSGQEGSERSRANGEVERQVDALVRVVPVEADQQREEQKDVFGL